MATPAAGQVVLLRFPFSDLSQTKLRPALILAAADRGDWIVCQITSNPFGDAHSIQLDQSSFAFGSLSRTSFVRPAKLFTANEALFASVAGTLEPETLATVRQRVATIVSGG
jgi:mRNA interferase MazF